MKKCLFPQPKRCGLEGRGQEHILGILRRVTVSQVLRVVLGSCRWVRRRLAETLCGQRISPDNDVTLAEEYRHCISLHRPQVQLRHRRIAGTRLLHIEHLRSLSHPPSLGGPRAGSDLESRDVLEASVGGTLAATEEVQTT